MLRKDADSQVGPKVYSGYLSSMDDEYLNHYVLNTVQGKVPLQREKVEITVAVALIDEANRLEPMIIFRGLQIS